MKPKNSQTIGYILAIVDMTIYGFLPVVSHYLVATLDPFLFSGLATFIGGIPLFLLLRKNNQHKLLYSKSFFKSLLIIGILSTLSSLLFFGGTKLTSGLNTGLLIQIEPFYALILGIIIFKETIKPNQLLATTIMVIGALIIVYKGVSSINIGDVFILTTPLVNQVSHLIAKNVMNKTNNSNLVATGRLIYSGLLLIIIALVTNPGSINQLFSLQNLAVIVIFGLIFRSLDLFLWYGAMKYISVSKASTVLPLAVAVSFTGSVFFLRESVSFQQLFGLIFILGGLIWLSLIYFNTKEVKA